MSIPSREEKLAEWLAAEQAMRANLGAPGSMSLAQVSELLPQEFFDGIGRGELPSPPIGHLLDFVPLEWSSGRFVFQGTPDARHYNPLGSVHGGYAATLLDSCMGCAVHTTLKAGQGYTSLEIKVNFVRPVMDTTGRVRAEGRVIHVGRTTATAEGKLIDANGKLLAHGTTTCIIFAA